MESDAFHHHMAALSSEFQQLRQENASLQKELDVLREQLQDFQKEQKDSKIERPEEHLRELARKDSDSEGSLQSLRPAAPVPPDALVAPEPLELTPLQTEAQAAEGLEGLLLEKEKLKSEVKLPPPPPKKTRISLDGDQSPSDSTSPQAKQVLPGCVENEEPQAATAEEAEAPEEQVTTKKSMNTRYSYVKDMAIQEPEDSEDHATFYLLLDVIPAIAILTSAVVAGLSADIDKDSALWKVLEIMFTLFFFGEIVVKLRVFGYRDYLWGSEWYWSWFDVLCVILALIDISITYASLASGQGAQASAWGTLKMLKLARLGRIVRLLKFKIFQELKLMIQGVFTGLRVLFWAIVLLVGCMYLMGVVARTMFMDLDGDGGEFDSVPAAMFTAFRCFTDGCSATDGTPLQETLRRKYGGIFMMVYILLFLFVTIGIFNLIMAVFIDNVTDGCTKKRQRELGQNAPKNAWKIAATLRNIILQKVLRKVAEDEARAEAASGPPGTARRVSKIFREKWEELRNLDEFNHWLSSHDGLLETLDDAEIDLSCKSDLFDVLDADMSGELEFEEMIDGLLKCRGPASKTDIIAIRLKARLLVRMMTAICQKLGIEV
ncbi:L type [Durusdinium trenchii]|uniref:L type n=1 Tax=Durusdinium trenchii TaxID=1381693 RepID=A0ABP0MER6_9DINO